MKHTFFFNDIIGGDFTKKLGTSPALELVYWGDSWGLRNAFFFASHAPLLVGVRFHSDCGYRFSVIIALDVFQSVQR